MKKTVDYTPHFSDHNKEGVAALIVNTHNHPDVTNTKPVYTTTVLKYDKVTGIFETKNTIYKPKDHG